MGRRLGGAISKNSEKLSQIGCFFVYNISMRNNNNNNNNNDNNNN